MADVMTDSKRFIVLETQEQAMTMIDLLEWIALTRQDLELKAINRRESSNIIYLLVRDIVDELLTHRNNNPENVEMIASIIFGVPKNKITKEHIAKYDNITREAMWNTICFNLRKQIEATVSKGTWTDWTVVKAGSLIGLSEGEDHRITEFHRETKALAVDDEAVLTLNCKNPINYLSNQFFKRYGSNVVILKELLLNPDVKFDPFYRNMLISFINDPTEYIVGLFLDTLVYMHPQIELSKNTINRSQFIERALDIHDMSSFQINVIQKLIMAFGMNWLNFEVKKDENYMVEYYLTTHVLAIFQKPFSSITEKYEAELLNAFNRGDYLPPEEREIAERLFIASSQRVLSLNT